MISGPITSITCCAARCTPNPSYHAGSPSRSSHASAAAVLAPLGTLARPAVPSDSRTSASTVGFPRLSSTSRAFTLRIFAISLHRHRLLRQAASLPTSDKQAACASDSLHRHRPQREPRGRALDLVDRGDVAELIHA